MLPALQYSIYALAVAPPCALAGVMYLHLYFFEMVPLCRNVLQRVLVHKLLLSSAAAGGWGREGWWWEFFIS